MGEVTMQHWQVTRKESEEEFLYSAHEAGS